MPRVIINAAVVPDKWWESDEDVVYVTIGDGTIPYGDAFKPAVENPSHRVTAQTEEN